MMAVATNATNAPIQAKRLPAAFMNDPTTPRRPCRPSAYSAIISGMLQTNRNTIQAIRKAPAPSAPPFWAAMRGKRQMLPVPTAMPSTLSSKPRRLAKRCSVSECPDMMRSGLIREMAWKENIRCREGRCLRYSLCLGGFLRVKSEALQTQR